MYEDFFATDWDNYNVKAMLKDHVGYVGSVHKQAMQICVDLLTKINTLTLY